MISVRRAGDGGGGGGGGGGRGGGGGGGRGRPDEAHKVYVGGLPWDVDDDTLKTAFEGFGDVRGLQLLHPGT
jgi:hypothetical protein